MVNSICDIVFDIFGSASWIAIIIIAMVPIIELRGAIPIANGMMSWWESYIFSVVGSTLPVFVIVPLLIPFFAWLKKRKWAKKFAERLENRFKSKGEYIQSEVDAEKNKKKKEAVKFLGVLCFVSIPLPLTGAWTGSAVAAYLGLGFKKSVLAVSLGNIISGGIMTFLCTLFRGSEDIILYAFLGLVVLLLVGSLVLKFLKKKKIIEKIEVEEKDFAHKETLEENKQVEDESSKTIDIEVEAIESVADAENLQVSSDISNSEEEKIIENEDDTNKK